MTTPTHAHAPMTQPPATEQPPPHSQPDAAAAADAGRRPGLFGRARAAARPAASTGALFTVIVLLAGAAGGFVMRELDSLKTDIGNLEAGVNQLRADIDAEFVKLEADMDARFVKLEKDMDDGFAEVDARFAAQDTKIDEIDLKLTALIAAQDTKIDEINLKLTALIAALNKTGEVDAALTGQLLDPAVVPAEARSAQP